LKERHKELLRKAMEINEEMEAELAKVPPKTEEVTFESIERQLESAIECANTEEKILLKEKKALKDKLKIDSSYDRIVKLEKELKEKLKRNKKMGKLVDQQEKGINRKDKKYCEVKQEIDNAKPNQVEEERLLRHINKEIIKQKEQEVELEQNLRAIQLKLKKGKELEEKILQKEKEMEALKKEYQMQSESRKLSDPADEFVDLNLIELKSLLVKVQNEREARKKSMAEKKADLVSQLVEAKETFKELTRQKKINGHRLQELTRLVKLSKIRRKDESDREVTNKDPLTRSQRIKSYQDKQRDDLACSMSSNNLSSTKAKDTPSKLNIVKLDLVTSTLNF
jgi:hypothetical protein